MTNVSGALETLGKGLFAMGQTQIRKEEDEIAYMRQQALQELGIKAQKEMQASNQEFLKGQETARSEHDKELFGMNAAARAGEQQAGFAHAERLQSESQKWDATRDASMKSFQLKLKESDNIETIIRSTNAMLGDIDKNIATWEQEMFTAESGGVADPAVIEKAQARIDALYAQQEQIRSAGQAAVSRLTGGKPVPPPEKKESPLFGAPVSEGYFGRGAATESPISSQGAKSPNRAPAPRRLEPAPQPISSAAPDQESVPWSQRASQTDAINAKIVAWAGELFKAGPENLRGPAPTMERRVQELKAQGKSTKEIVALLGPDATKFGA